MQKAELGCSQPESCYAPGPCDDASDGSVVMVTVMMRVLTVALEKMMVMSMAIAVCIVMCMSSKEC